MRYERESPKLDHLDIECGCGARLQFDGVWHAAARMAERFMETHGDCTGTPGRPQRVESTQVRAIGEAPR